MARLGVGLREHRVKTGDAGVRDEPLRPVEHVLPVVTSRNRAHRGGVGAGAGLGQRVRGEHLARRESRQPGRALLVRAAELEPERAELLHREDQPARGADLRDLLDRDERQQRSRPGAADLLAEEEAEDPLVAEELDDVPRELVRRVDLGRPRRDPLARHGPHEFAQLALLLAQDVPGHGSKSRTRERCRSSCGAAGDAFRDLPRRRRRIEPPNPLLRIRLANRLSRRASRPGRTCSPRRSCRRARSPGGPPR